MLSKLIEALNIFLKYGDPDSPTHCEHDRLVICGIAPEDVSEEDIEKLFELGFVVACPFGPSVFQSYKYGSA